jgi:hypothetical protein
LTKFLEYQATKDEGLKKALGLKGPYMGAYLGSEDTQELDLPPAPPANNQGLRGINLNDPNPVISHPYATIDEYVNKHEEDFKRYLCGLIDPEFAYQKGLQIKIPNPLPIPSTTFTQVSSFSLNANTGKFWLCWNPSFPTTKSGISKFKFYRDSIVGNDEPFKETSVNATQACNCFWGRDKNELNFHYDQLPDVEVSRMRLVSAKMKVTYRGSSDSLSGKLVSCATFQPMPNTVVHDANGTGFVYFFSDELGWYRPLPNTLLSFATTGYSSGTQLIEDNLVSNDPDRTDVLSGQAVINGIWGKSVTLSEINRGLTCTYLPVDNDSSVFTAPGTIRGSVLTKKIDQEYREGNKILNEFTRQLEVGDQAGELYIHNCGSPIIDLHGGRMGFIVVGEGLPSIDTAIDVEFYYNWEILPTTASASSMRNYSTAYVPSETMFKDMMTNIKINEASIALIKNSDIGNLRGEERLGSWFSFLAPIAKAVAAPVGNLLSKFASN